MKGKAKKRKPATLAEELSLELRILHGEKEKLQNKIRHEVNEIGRLDKEIISLSLRLARAIRGNAHVAFIEEQEKYPIRRVAPRLHNKPTVTYTPPSTDIEGASNALASLLEGGAK